MDNKPKNIEIAKKPMGSAPSLAPKSPTPQASNAGASKAAQGANPGTATPSSGPAASMQKTGDAANKTPGTPSAAMHDAENLAKNTQADGKMMARKAASTMDDMAKTSKDAAANVVNLGASNMRSAMEKGATETRKMQDKASEMSREGAAQLSRQSEMASRMMGEISSIAKSHLEACMESGNIAANMTREMSNELTAYANDMLTRNVEISKNLFTCRTVNDLFDLQNKMIRSNLDNFFNESSKLSEMLFNYANKAAEPINESMQSASQRLGKKAAA